MSRPKRMQNILLMGDVPKLGKAGDLVQVAPGYARNFLLPKSLGAKPTDENLRLVDQRKRRFEADRSVRDAMFAELAERIPQTNVTLEMKASAEGHLYGAVTPALVAQAMQDAGLEIFADHVRLEHSIKEIGQFDVPIHVYADVVVNARLWVVSAPE